MTSTKNFYDKYWSPAGYCPEGHLPHAVQEILNTHIQTGSRCLDVGCGDGSSVGPWLLARKCTYMGVDISQNAIQKAASSGLQAKLIKDASSLPFPDDSFDAALCLEVLEHLFEPHLALAEMLRVLKPGGVLVTTVPNVAYWRRRLDLALLGRWNPIGDDLSVEQPWRDPHIRFFTPPSLKRLIASTGYYPVHISGHDGSLIRDIPWLGRRVWRGKQSPLYRVFEKAFPSLFGHRLNATALKPLSPELMVRHSKKPRATLILRLPFRNLGVKQ